MPCMSRVEIIRRQMSKARTFEEWRALAAELDRWTGNNKLKYSAQN